jgi:phage N-6-adenine-methyltransferase
MNMLSDLKIPFHPLADIFPLISGDEFDALRDDIAAHGVREPVVLFEGAILDGRNRYRASLAAGVDCPMTEYRGDDAAAFVVSLNIHRRHLTESQRAMAAAKLANMPAHRPVKSANLPTSEPVLPTFEPEAPKPAPVPQAEAARLLNVSERSLRTAKKVQDTAPQEVVAAVQTGHISVSLAAQVAELPEEVQAEVAAAEPEAMKEAAREAVKNVRGTQGTGNDEWYTPQHLIEKARATLGAFDVDPASNDVAQAKVQAAQYFTAETDGLSQEWHGRVWLNPPYSQPLIGQFMAKLCEEYTAGRCIAAVALTHNYTDTRWFQDTARHASAICFTRGRVKFYSPTGEIAAPTQGQAFFYFGDDVAGFAREFGEVGFVVEVKHG